MIKKSQISSALPKLLSGTSQPVIRINQINKLEKVVFVNHSKEVFYLQTRMIKESQYC